ncbi:MAG: fibronectin type III domain-containing protein [Deltaproteobacteria bacterium]|nr:fibronectin type III domain-containing protein [Deltaproteobacteria bacterium]
MRFPLREADVLKLAERMEAGFSRNASTFSALPVPLHKFKQAVINYNLSINNFVSARSAMNKTSQAKKAARQKLVKIMKREIRYAENVATGDEEALDSVGWGKRRIPPPIEPPEACYNFKIDKEGKGWLSFSWEKTEEGGKPTFYIIDRKTENGVWKKAGRALETKKDLVDQPIGILLEYRVIAANKAGESEPCDTVVKVTL